MNKSSLRAGSTLLSCIFFISLVMLIVLMQWRSQEALQNIAIMRVLQIKKQYATQALLNYGIKVGKQNYEIIQNNLKERSVPLVLTFTHWPLGAGEYAAGSLEFDYKKTMKITATLKEKNEKPLSFTGELDKITSASNDIYTINAWQKVHH